MSNENVHVSNKVPRYELRVNSTMVDLSNSLSDIEKGYAKSNSRTVQLFLIDSAGDKHLIKQKNNHVGTTAILGGEKLADVFREHGLKAWQKASAKAQNNPQRKAA